MARLLKQLNPRETDKKIASLQGENKNLMKDSNVLKAQGITVKNGKLSLVINGKKVIDNVTNAGLIIGAVFEFAKAIKGQDLSNVNVLINMPKLIKRMLAQVEKATGQQTSNENAGQTRIRKGPKAAEWTAGTKFQMRINKQELMECEIKEVKKDGSIVMTPSDFNKFRNQMSQKSNKFQCIRSSKTVIASKKDIEEYRQL